MFNCVFRADCSLQCEATQDWYTSLVMVLFLDSLGECVSALSKRFAAAESIRDTVNCLPHSHREKHSEVRHRKDTHHQQEDTPKPMVEKATPAAIFIIVNGVMSCLFVKDLFYCWFFKMSCNESYSSWIVSDSGNQWQSSHLHSKEAKPQLRVRHRTYPQTERRAEGSIQGARDHSTW